jgi:hypothetical protein
MDTDDTPLLVEDDYEDPDVPGTGGAPVRRDMEGLEVVHKQRENSLISAAPEAYDATPPLSDAQIDVIGGVISEIAHDLRTEAVARERSILERQQVELRAQRTALEAVDSALC